MGDKQLGCFKQFIKESIILKDTSDSWVGENKILKTFSWVVGSNILKDIFGMLKRVLMDDWKAVWMLQTIY